MALVDEITNIIELNEERTPVDKEDLIKSTIESYRGSHPLLERVIRRETTSQETYEPLLQKRYRRKLTEEERSIMEDNQELIDLTSIYSSDSIFSNPLRGSAFLAIAFGLGYSAVFGIFNLLGFPSSYTPPPDVSMGMYYLENLFRTVIGSSIIGGLVGCACWNSEEKKLRPERERKRSGLELLDNQIREIYGGKENKNIP